MATNPWDVEYKRKGIPSSFRDEPSGVLLWALDCWPHIEGTTGTPSSVLDIGCGTGRNALFLASAGATVVAFDGSQEAVAIARKRMNDVDHGIASRVDLRHHRLEDGLPAASNSIDFATDIFVYKHQMDDDGRRAYRQELRRCLTANGVLLLSLAGRDDGYYSQCPDVSGPEGPMRKIIDPVANVGSVLFSFDELRDEMSDTFRMHMAWEKRKLGMMHGTEYLRETLVTLWGPR